MDPRTDQINPGCVRYRAILMLIPFLPITHNACEVSRSWLYDVDSYYTGCSYDLFTTLANSDVPTISVFDARLESC